MELLAVLLAVVAILSIIGSLVLLFARTDTLKSRIDLFQHEFWDLHDEVHDNRPKSTSCSTSQPSCCDTPKAEPMAVLIHATVDKMLAGDLKNDTSAGQSELDLGFAALLSVIQKNQPLWEKLSQMVLMHQPPRPQFPVKPPRLFRPADVSPPEPAGLKPEEGQ